MARPFYWFAGESVRELRRQLDVVGDEARVEFHVDGNHATIEVQEPAQEGVEPLRPLPRINDSHICPPVCP